MAKIASSKPYGSGTKSKSKTTTPKRKNSERKEVEEVVSPVRTSPRRRKIEGEPEVAEIIPQPTGKKGKKPAAPKFNEPTQKKKSSASRRKSLIEPAIVEAGEPEPEYNEKVSEYEAKQDGEFEFDYVESVQSSSIYNPLESETYEENSPIFEEEAEQDTEDIVEEETNSSEEFHYDEEEEDYESNENLSEALNEEEYNDQFKYTSESVKARLAQYFNRQERALSSAISSLTSSSSSSSNLRSQMWNRMKNWVSDNLIVSARELSEITMEYTKKAVEEISKRLEVKKNEENVLVIDTDEPGDAQFMDQIGEAYMDEPRIYEIIENENEIRDDTVQDLDESECKRARLMDYEEGEEDRTVIISNNEAENTMKAPNQPSNHSSFHSIPVSEGSQNVLTETTSAANYALNTFKSDVMESRLTELVLFFAKCTNDTPLPSIYEHLEEFFTLKGENSLNFTEKQLISGVIKEYLTERQSERKEAEVPIAVPQYPMTESSPKRIKVLPSSGVRFRAPKFTAEEEARLEELEQIRQKNLAASNVSRMSTPMQRSKLQKKLLAPEQTAEELEKMPLSKGRISFKKDKKTEDSVSSAIEDIISQKMREARQKEESERIETEKLKARVAELERESRDRATKEALLQKQLEEQKKELEIERKATQEKIEKIKLESIVKVPASGSIGGVGTLSTGTGIGNVPTASIPVSKPTAVPSFSASTFSFGKKEEPSTALSEEKPPFSFNTTTTTTESTLNPNAPSFKSFEFGSSASGSGEKKEAEGLKSFGFSFGAKDSASEKAAFNFGTDKIAEEKEKKEPATMFNFGAKPEEASKPAFNFESSKPSFSFGTSAASKPAAAEDSTEKSAFNFASVKPAAATVFNFGTKSEDSGKPALNFGVKTDDKSAGNEGAFKTGFSFGAKVEDSSTPKPSSFNFGSSMSSSSFNFGKNDESSSGTKAFNFGSSTVGSANNNNNNAFKPFTFGSSASTSASTSTSVSNAFPTSTSAASTSTNSNNNNPFAALNSTTNIFNSTAPVTFGGFNNNNSNNVANVNPFTFPPISAVPPSGGIVPMNFGAPSSMETSENGGGFQTGHRPISIPKRRFLRK